MGYGLYQNGTTALRQKILTELNELRFRKALKKRKYNDILKDMKTILNNLDDSYRSKLALGAYFSRLSVLYV